MLRDPKAEARIAHQLKPRKLTAKQLGVKREFLRAFDRVLKAFKSGKVRHERQGIVGVAPAFNMAYWQCGSVCCIGGFCQREMGLRLRWGQSWESAFFADGAEQGQCTQLYELFFPKDHEGGEYTLQQAISAMESWRTTGVTKWP